MNLKQILVLLTFLSTIHVKENYTMEGNIHELDTSNTKPFLNENKYALIYGYIPSCDSCKKVDNFIQDFSAQVNNLGVKVGRIDLSKNTDVVKTLRATYLPYISLFINGVVKLYQGNLDQESVYKWVSQLVNIEPKIETITTKEDYKNFMASQFIVGMKYPENDMKAEGVLEAFSKIYHNVKFCKITGEAANEIESKYEFLMVRKYDDGDKTLSGEQMPDLVMMQQFFELFKRPYIVKLDAAILDEINSSRTPTIIIFDKDYDTQAIKNLQTDAFKYRQRALLVMSNMEEAGADTMISLFDVTEENLPVIGIMDFKGGKLRKFRSTDLSVDGIKTFLDSYLKDSLKEYIKSESVQGTQQAIKKVVLDNFDSIVKDKTKHVLLGIYNDSCSYCSEMHEAFEKAQKELKKGNEDIVFAKLNIDKNDIEIQLKGLPSIYLYKKNEKENPIEYPLIRDWEVILDWIEREIDRKPIYNRPMPENIKKQMPKGHKDIGNDNEETIEEL